MDVLRDKLNWWISSSMVLLGKGGGELNNSTMEGLRDAWCWWLEGWWLGVVKGDEGCCLWKGGLDILMDWDDES